METQHDSNDVKNFALNADLPLLYAWERRRWVYNAILAGLVVILVLLFRRELVFDARFCAFLIAEALFANVCFCVGPVVDGYLHGMGLVAPVSSRLLFAGGLIVSIPLTALSVLLYNMPMV